MTTEKHLIAIITLFTCLIPTIMTNEINCTTTDHCRYDPIKCTSNEQCIVNCLGSSTDLSVKDDACTDTRLYCVNHQSCTVTCDGAQVCWGLEVYCPNNSECNIIIPYNPIKPYGYRAMAWTHIYGGYNGTLNVRNNANAGLELCTITCPINGDCNIYSKNTLNVTSNHYYMYMDVVFNATFSNTLNISVEGYDDSLVSSEIFCPMTSMKTRPNCIVRISDGGDSNVRRLIRRTYIYINHYTDLYLEANAIHCDDCTAQLQLNCVEYEERCDATLVNNTSNEWKCADPTKHTQCPTPNPTTDIPTDTMIAISSTEKSVSSVILTTKRSHEGLIRKIEEHILVYCVVLSVLLLMICLVVLIVCCVVKHNSVHGLGTSIYNEKQLSTEIEKARSVTHERRVVDVEQTTIGTPRGLHKRDPKSALDVYYWLKHVKLQSYYHIFMDNGYESLSIIREISNSTELTEIGIDSTHHQTILLREIVELNRRAF